MLLRKKKVDEVELLLQKNAQNIIAKQQEVDALVAELATLEEPKSGIYQAFLTFIYHKEEYHANIDFKMQELAALKQEKKRLEEDFKLQNIEYEKAKYLEDLERKKILHKTRIQENKELDEVSVMLYANKKH